MTVGMVMTVWNIKTVHRRNLLRIVLTMPTVITLSPTLYQIWGFGALAKEGVGVSRAYQ